MSSLASTTIYKKVDKVTFMGNVRLHPSTKAALEHIGGQDYSLDEVVNILLDNFIEPDDDDDEDQLSLFDFDNDEDED